MKYRDEVLRFDCAGESLLGVLSRPEQPLPTAVVMIVGGPQYRIGSHRQFLLLAHALAEQGHAVLRFDYRGMGDSSGAARDFEQVEADVAAAIDAALAALPGLRQVALWGLCDAASAALLYLHARPDPRVRGLCLINPWVRSEQTLTEARVKHYYRERLMSRDFWAKLLRGGLKPAALGEFLASAGRLLKAKLASQQPKRDTAQALSYQARMLAAWQAFPHPVQLLLSGRDLTAQEFRLHAEADPAWRALLAHTVHLHLCPMPDADHTFSNAQARAEVLAHSSAWLTRVNRHTAPESTAL
jgi:uncharacterized protein